MLVIKYSMSEMFATLCVYVKKTVEVVMSIFYKPFGFYLVWITLHYISAHIYTSICVPLTLWGFISAPFIVMNPLCGGIEWVIHNSLIVIANMWIALGTWVTANVLFTTYNSMRDNILK